MNTALATAPAATTHNTRHALALRGIALAAFMQIGCMASAHAGDIVQSSVAQQQTSVSAPAPVTQRAAQRVNNTGGHVMTITSPTGPAGQGNRSDYVGHVTLLR